MAFAAPLHGGDLDYAIRTGDALGFDVGRKEEWLDLSTGINPTPYPVSNFSPELWHCLPSPSAHDALINVARDYYRVPEGAELLAASGSALLISLLPVVLPELPVKVLSPTYSDHERSWAHSRNSVTAVSRLPEPGPSVVVLTNPNNPDGRMLRLEELAKFAHCQTKQGGWLVVDEAFGDLIPEESAVSLSAYFNVIVLKSVGKFFGLGGLRLGFVVTPTYLALNFKHLLGSWSVSGPALEIGSKALSDVQWQKATLQALQVKSDRLTDLLKEGGLLSPGGTFLYRLVDSSDASNIYGNLLRAKIFVRAFDYNSNWLRIGLPADDDGFERLKDALSGS